MQLGFLGFAGFLLCLFVCSEIGKTYSIEYTLISINY